MLPPIEQCPSLAVRGEVFDGRNGHAARGLDVRSNTKSRFIEEKLPNIITYAVQGRPVAQVQAGQWANRIGGSNLCHAHGHSSIVELRRRVGIDLTLELGRGRVNAICGQTGQSAI